MNNEMDDFSAKPGVPNMFGLIGAEAKDISLLERYLPKALSEEEIEKAVRTLKEKHGPNMGAIMKEAKEIPGIDMKKASQILKTL